MKPTFVIDTSIVIKWTVPEADAELAVKLRGSNLLAPDLLRMECSNVLWRMVKMGSLPADEAFGSMADIASGPIRFHSCEPLEMDALRIAIDLQHPVYDCYFLALSRREGAPLVTDDRRLIAAARRSEEFRPLILSLPEAVAANP